MTGFAETGIESKLLLCRSIGKTFKALLEIGVVISKTDPGRNRNHNPAQVGPLEQCRSSSRRQSVEIKQSGAASITQHTPKLPEASSWISQISQTVGHQSPVDTGIRHLQVQSIALLPAHRQPRFTGRSPGCDLQWRSGHIHTEHRATRAQSPGQRKGEITCSATEIKPLLSRPR